MKKLQLQIQTQYNTIQYNIHQEKNGGGHEALQKTRSVDWFANIFHIHKVIPLMMIIHKVKPLMMMVVMTITMMMCC